MSGKKAIRGRKALEHLHRQVTAMQTCQITLKGQGSAWLFHEVRDGVPKPVEDMNYIEETSRHGVEVKRR